MKQQVSFFLVVLSVIYCACLIVANIIAGKLWLTPLPGIVLTAGVLCFPVVYIIDDVVPEVYGFGLARKVIWLGFAANLLAVIFFLLTLGLAYPPFFDGQKAFEVVLGFTPRLLLASFIAYLVGTNVNAWVMVQVKRLTQARFLWMRTISSTIVGQAFDSTIFMTIAFLGIVPLDALPLMIISQALFKSGYEALATPLTYLVVHWVKEIEQVSDVQYRAALAE